MSIRWIGIVVAFGFVAARGDAETAGTVGAKIADFKLADFRGKDHALADWADKPVVVVAFLGVDCPLAKLYAPKLEALAREFGPRGVAFLAVDSNSQDSITEMAAYAHRHELSIPFLKDPGNKIADQFAAERTPEVFVLDKHRVVRYRGRIDDQYGLGASAGYAKFQTRAEYLKDALNQVLGGKPISTDQVAAVGCIIGRVPTTEPRGPITYSKHIARIMQDRCVSCHRPGEIAPFTLTSHEDVSGWGAMIREVTKEERMPPWFADPKHGKFSNDARLTDEEKRQIDQWVANGCPEGNPADLPEKKIFVDGWSIGTPDQIVEMAKRPYKVKAEGVVNYQYFIADPGFKEDKWIKASEARPGNRGVVHHIIVFVLPEGAGPALLRSRLGGGGGRGGRDFRPDGGDRPDAGIDGADRFRRGGPVGEGPFRRGGAGGLDGGLRGGGMLATYAPGSAANVAPDGSAIFVKKGSQLVFQMHYTANGSPQEDLSYVGLIFADPATVKRPVIGGGVSARRNLVIPPHADNHKVEASQRLRRDTLLISMSPHMHLRGKAFRYEAEYPDGKREILLDVPRYDASWQMTYELEEPKKLPAGTTIYCTAHFDNSESNLANPDPNAEVRWGPQTWDEMMIGFFKALPVQEGTSPEPTPDPRPDDDDRADAR